MSGAGYSLISRLSCRLLDHFARSSVFCIGDSHIRVFENPRMRWAFPRIRFNVVSVPGATASGLVNPNSKTQARRIFLESLPPGNASTPVVILLGEVDTGFVIWWRAQKRGESVPEIFNHAVGAYTQFIDGLPYKKKIVISAPLPTIADGAMVDEVMNLRREVQASQQERTQLALKFNSSVKAYSEGKGIIYIDLDSDSIDRGTGLVRKALVRSNAPGDNHYDKSEYAKMLLPHVSKALHQRCGL